MAVRYLKANCDFPVAIKEFTINDRFERIFAEVVAADPEIVAFSVYLWNVTLIRRLTEALKTKTQAIVLWGGPEVSFDPEVEFTRSSVDYIIVGEGELAFNRFVAAWADHGDMAAVPNLVYRKDGEIVSTRIEPITDLSLLRNPYHFPEFDAEIGNKIQYLEISRGCPYRCTFCLASLSGGVRFFPFAEVGKTILHLLSNGAKVFKFLDRTFNFREDMARQVIDFIVGLDRPDLSFQFEITGDILSDALIDHLNATAPAGLVRFEIGVQSTNPETTKLVQRPQNNDRLFRAIRKIQEGKVVDLHLDLIAGLPKEDITSFETTFNETLSCYPKELQLGFLKLLRGTPIRRDHERYGYKFSPDPPYEIVENNTLSAKDLAKIKLVEKALNIHYNKGFMNETIRWLAENVASPFAFFLSLGEFYETRGYGFTRYQLLDVFVRLNEFVLAAYPEISIQVLSLLKLDYLNYHRQRPKIWWEKLPYKHDLLVAYCEKDDRFPLDYLCRHAIVTTFMDHYLITLYLKEGPLVIHHRP